MLYIMNYITYCILYVKYHMIYHILYIKNIHIIYNIGYRVYIILYACVLYFVFMYYILSII